MVLMHRIVSLADELLQVRAGRNASVGHAGAANELAHGIVGEPKLDRHAA